MELSRSPPSHWRCCVPAAASAHAYLVKTVPAASVILTTAADGRAAHVRRGGRAALRDHLGHRRPRPSGDDRRGYALAVGSRHARRPDQARGRGLVPRLLARDLGRRPSGAGSVHVRGRAERGAGAAVQDPAHRGHGDLDAARDREVARLPDADDRDRAVRAADRDRAAARPPRRRDEPARTLDRVRDRRRTRL